jgi:hypothetical protein
MPTDTLQDFVQARLLAYDPLIDLSPGSPAQEQVVIPIVTRFQPDPLEMSVEEFIDACLAQELPDLNIDEGTGVRDFLVKPDQILMDPVLRELQLIKQGQSLANPELLADAEADALVANFFVSRNLGNLATGRVRLYFNAPVAINITIGNVCFTADGHRFLPTTLQSISAEAMIFNASGSLYYFDVKVTAEAAGDDYNIPAGYIVGITNLSVAVRATNLSAFTGGLLRENTSSLVARAQQSVTERSLVVPRGTIARLQDQFNDLRQIQIVGNGDVEMQRDLIVGGDLGSIIMEGSDGVAIDDGKGGNTTTSFSTLFGHFTDVLPIGHVAEHYLQTSAVAQGNDGSVNVSFLGEFISPTAVFVPSDVGKMLVMMQSAHTENLGKFLITGLGTHPNTVTLKTVANVNWVGAAEGSDILWILIRGQEEYLIEEVLAPGNALRLASDHKIELTPYPISWAIRKKELTLSNIPGGIVFGDQANTMPSDTIHVGGCTDFYVAGTGTSTSLMTLSNVVDGEPLVSSDMGSISLAYTPPRLLYDGSVNFVTSGVQPGMLVKILTDGAGNEGTYTVVRVGADPDGSVSTPLSPHYLQVDRDFTGTVSENGVEYSIHAAVVIDLLEPKTVKGAGIEGNTVQLSNVFTTYDFVDFSALGVAVNDILRILTGADAGDYLVTAVSGTGNRDLILSKPTTSTANNVKWEVFSLQAAMQLPLVRINRIDLLDGGMSPTGVTLPYADPVDARSVAFSNAAHGVKLSATEATVGIVGTVDLSTMSTLGATTLDVHINGSLHSVVLTGASSASQVVDKINAVVPNLAHILDAPNSAQYLTLRNRDRYILVDHDVVGVGLHSQDDSRQIKITSSVALDALSYDLRAGSDVVSITIGEDVGNFYLVKVASDRLYVVGFDESSRDVQFLTPCMDVSLTVGSRSLGSSRVYFLEPTSFEVRGSYRPALNSEQINPANQQALVTGDFIGIAEKPASYFTWKGSTMRFIPDPALSYTVVLNETTSIPNNLTLTGSLAKSDPAPAGDLGKGSRLGVGIDFLANGLVVGDIIDITYQPLQGTLNIDPPPPMAGQKLILRVDGKLYTVDFVAASTAKEIADKINAVIPITHFANIEVIDSTHNYLRLEADARILIIAGGSYLGIALTDNTSYAADHGPYYVTALSSAVSGYMLYPNQVQIADGQGNPPPAPPPGHSNQAHHFIIRRAGIQRAHTKAMSANSEFGLYYMDVELVSEGSGDTWNIPDGQVLVVTGHTSDGYTLEVADPNLTYSTQEHVKLRMSNTILDVTQSDRKGDATLIDHVNIQLTYEMSPLVSSIQAFASAELDRVLTASILVRHLQPAYINFDMNYSGGSAIDVVLKDVHTYLAGLSPNDQVESSSLQGFAKSRGATYVFNPITLLAVTYDENRKIVVSRSTNRVSHSRLSTFFPGVINITQS